MGEISLHGLKEKKFIEHYSAQLSVKLLDHEDI